VKAHIKVSFDDAYFSFEFKPEWTMEEGANALHNYLPKWVSENIQELVRNVQINYTAEEQLG
jgi:hypothetical protein